mgnify:CR=1 FL=1
MASVVYVATSTTQITAQTSSDVEVSTTNDVTEVVISNLQALFPLSHLLPTRELQVKQLLALTHHLLTPPIMLFSVMLTKNL